MPRREAARGGAGKTSDPGYLSYADYLAEVLPGEEAAVAAAADIEAELREIEVNDDRWWSCDFYW